MKRLMLTMVLLLLAAASGHAQVLFVEDFEGFFPGCTWDQGCFPQWTGKGAGGEHSGVISTDPLNPTNLVLSFTGWTSGGDIFSDELPVLPNTQYLLSFDYLGLPSMGGVPDDLGGFIGIVDDVDGFLYPEQWIAGTHDQGTVWVLLTDDGTWHHYDILIDPFSYFIPPDSLIRIMVEDFESSFGVIGDVFFDNIQLQKVLPVPIESTSWGRIKELYRDETAIEEGDQ